MDCGSTLRRATSPHLAPPFLWLDADLLVCVAERADSMRDAFSLASTCRPVRSLLKAASRSFGDVGRFLRWLHRDRTAERLQIRRREAARHFADPWTGGKCILLCSERRDYLQMEEEVESKKTARNAIRVRRDTVFLGRERGTKAVQAWGGGGVVVFLPDSAKKDFPSAIGMRAERMEEAVNAMRAEAGRRRVHGERGRATMESLHAYLEGAYHRESQRVGVPIPAFHVLAEKIRVLEVGVGMDHTVFAAEEGGFGIGSNEFGQLGKDPRLWKGGRAAVKIVGVGGVGRGSEKGGKGSNEKRVLGVKGVAAGRRHSLLLVGGTVLSFGGEESGLGRHCGEGAEGEEHWRPTGVQFWSAETVAAVPLSKSFVAAVSVAAGGEASVVADEEGRVWECSPLLTHGRRRRHLSEHMVEVRFEEGPPPFCEVSVFASPSGSRFWAAAGGNVFEWGMASDPLLQFGDFPHSAPSAPSAPSASSVPSASSSLSAMPPLPCFPSRPPPKLVVTLQQVPTDIRKGWPLCAPFAAKRFGRGKGWE